MFTRSGLQAVLRLFSFFVGERETREETLKTRSNKREREKGTGLCLLMTVNTMQRFVQSRNFFARMRWKYSCIAVKTKRKPSDMLASSVF